jgi:ATP-dependent helicase HrpA
LLPAGFLRDTPAEWSAQYPRYAKALRTRLERLAGQYAKDQKYTAMLQALAEPLWNAVRDRPGLLLLCPAAAQYRWMLEELRVSLFAQNLGTRQAVSEKRLQEQWRTVRDWLDKNPA